MRQNYLFLSCLVCAILLWFNGCGDSQSKSYYEQFSKDFASLDKSQKSFIQNTYHSLEQERYPDDFIYALLAIAWQESSFGKNVYNHKDPSCGAYQQIIAKHYLNHLELKDQSLWAKSELCLVLIENQGSALSQAIDRLKEWQRKYKDKQDMWEYVFRSYNAGHNHNKEEGKVYAKMIKARVKVLEKRLESVLE